VNTLVVFLGYSFHLHLFQNSLPLNPLENNIRNFSINLNLAFENVMPEFTE
jgi:hypothetical protein